MKFRLFSLPVSAILATGLMLAQTPGTPSTGTEQGQRRHGGFQRGGMFQSLNLTDAQKQQAKDIFQSGRDANRALHQQLRDAREALNQAAKSGATDAQIDQLAAKIGPLSAQAAAGEAKSFAKFYAILTPEQRTQLDQQRTDRRGAMMRKNWKRSGANAGGIQ